MAILEITRSSEYANRFRKIKIYLNGEELGMIANGETKSFEIINGSHSLQAKIDWCASNKLTFTIGEGERKAINLTSFSQNNQLGVFAAIYYTTFGANKYLNLKETVI